VTAEVGIPFFIGVAPIHCAEKPAEAGTPVLCTGMGEAIQKLGFAEDWKKYNLCECMVSHFELFGCQPAVFCNLLDMATMTTTVTPKDFNVTDHKVELPFETIDDAALRVRRAVSPADYLVRGTDYGVYHTGENLIIELLPDGTDYAAVKLNITYKAVNPAVVTPTVVAAGLQNIEKCLTAVGLVPDLIVAPGFSTNATVAAVMATKANGINGMFKAKALVDISTAETGGAVSYDAAFQRKASGNIVGKEQIPCWPMLKLGDRTFHMSTQLAGLMATVDAANEGIPYESPSNKAFKCDAIVLESGKEVILEHAQANILNAHGIVTALNFLGGIVAWGNYTACHPKSTDIKDLFIPVSRMFGWIGNSILKTFWARLDSPMNTRLIGSILDTCNIWLNGLVGAEYLLGARAEFRPDENPVTDLMAGRIKIHILNAPPPPMQQADFILEYDVNYLKSAFAGS